MLSVVPQLADMTGLCGLGQVIWFVWLGIVLLRGGVKGEPATLSLSNRELA